MGMRNRRIVRAYSRNTQAPQMTTAIIAATIAAGAWLFIRLSEASRQIDGIIETVLSTPLDYDDDCDCEKIGQ